ncbi:MAG TPA: phytochelatin synthase family protein [Bdellovibrionota bacterium]|nr:phytochelatin synthase family protein [Bdellovibrionota bacterium]
MSGETTFQRILKRYESGFRQATECSCGPASLVLIADALGLPAKEESACYDPKFGKWLRVDEFENRGMAIHELALAAELIFGSEVEVLLRRAFPENLHQFISDLKECRDRDQSTMILNFAQDHVTGRTFQDQGYPHHSPVAGFDEKGVQVLIADVDSEVTAAKLVPVSTVFEAMAFMNPAFGVPRGWLLIRKRSKGAG